MFGLRLAITCAVIFLPILILLVNTVQHKDAVLANKFGVFSVIAAFVFMALSFIGFFIGIILAIWGV